MVAGGIDAYRLVPGLPQGHVGEEVHEAFEQAYMALRFTVRMPYQRDVLAFQAALVVGIAHLVASGQVAESQSEVVPFPQLVVHLPAEHPADVGVYHPGMEVRQQRMVSQWYHLYIPHVRFHGLEHRHREPFSRQVADSGLLSDTGQHLAHAVRPVQVLPKFHEVAAGGLPEIIPLVEPVVDLERRRVLLPQRREIPVLTFAYPDRAVPQ